MSQIKDKIILSNIQKYKVDDVDCENLCLKAMKYGIKKVLVGPSSVPLVKKLLLGSSVEMGVSISYPAGTYLPEAKAEEVEELAALHPSVSTFYVVMAVGRFLSGYEEEIRQEMSRTVQAAAGKDVYFMVESAIMSEAQLKKVCEMAQEAGVCGIVDTTGFKPYDVPFPTAEDTKQLASASNTLHVVANGLIETRKEVEDALLAGADEVVVVNADYLAER